MRRLKEGKKERRKKNKFNYVEKKLNYIIDILN